jgi:pSer/pThr/pTyr-binding forkhead associated (FHA) protein
MSLDVLLLILRLITAAALYAFLGAVLYYIWRDVRAISEQYPDRQRPMGKLIVVKSEDVPIHVGREFALQPLTTLGRGPGNTIVLQDTFASNEHAQVVWKRGQWWLEDQKSKNGTVVNDIPVTEPVVLSSGDEIAVGRVRFRLEIES